MSLSFDFTGKVALITGSSSGIGAATAIELSRAGAQVVVTGRNAEKVSSVAKQCLEVSPNQSKALEVVADVSEEQDCDRLIGQTIKEFGRIDILVNIAGIYFYNKITSPEFWPNYKQIFSTNLNSVVYLTHISVKHLEKTKGIIINISSTASTLANPSANAYCMSKSAMDMFTKCMAVELGAKGIRVNSVNPALVRTSMIEAFMNKKEAELFWDKFGKLYPVGRVGNPEDIANAIMFLASKQSSFITGIALVADGGHTAANVHFIGDKE